MPTGIYKRTEESNRKRSLIMKGRWKEKNSNLNSKERNEKLKQKAILQWSSMNKKQRIEQGEI